MGRDADVPATTCYRHSTEHAGVRCQRCDRFICPDCMTPVPVGFHCRDCMRQGGQKVFDLRTMTGGQASPTTQAIAGLTVLVFAAGFAMVGRVEPKTPQAALDAFGLLRGAIADRGQLYRLVTHGLVHVDLMHLLMNMLGLAFLGPALEQRLGAVKFILLYLVAVLGGAFGALWYAPTALTAGASGGIFGLMAAQLIDERSRGRSFSETSVFQYILMSFAFTALMPGVSVGGHVGGFIFGGLADYALLGLTVRQQKMKLGEAGLAGLLLLAVAGSWWAARLPLDRFGG
jgi:membrane associated rhomboid family serine protease